MSDYKAQADSLDQEHDKPGDGAHPESLEDDEMLADPWTSSARLLTKDSQDLFENYRLNRVEESECPIESLLAQRQQQSHRRALWRWRLAAVLSTAALVVNIAITYLFPHWPSTMRGPKDTMASNVVQDVHMSCGNTTKSAVSRACTFHPLSNRWLPGRCNLDHAEAAIASVLNTDMEDLPFKFWIDPAGESEIKDWSRLEMGTIVWTTQSHHVAHCLSILLQAAAVLQFDEMADETARDWLHTTSCVETIMTAVSAHEGWSQINSFFPIKGGECW